MIRTRRPLACHHEAGHAVARWWLGFHTDDAAVLTVDEVRAGATLADRKGRSHRCEGIVNGYDIHTPMAREIAAGSWDTEEHRSAFATQAGRRVEMAIVELYAGPHAEVAYTKRSALDRFLAGGMGDVNAVREIAEGWFATEEESKAARARADAIARALIRSPKAWTAVQAIASALLDRGRIKGDEVDALCASAFGGPFAYDRWAEAWPPSPAQIRSGFLPAERQRAA